MKVLKEVVRRYYTCTCNNCKSELELEDYEFDSLEAEMARKWDRRIYSENGKHICCPVCTADLAINITNQIGFVQYKDGSTKTM